MNHQYNLQKIRDLLNDGFTEEELRNVCFYEEKFKPVHDQLSQTTRKSEIIRLLIDYAQRKGLLDTLLEKIRIENRGMYNSYLPYTNVKPHDDSINTNEPSKVKDTGEKQTHRPTPLQSNESVEDSHVSQPKSTPNISSFVSDNVPIKDQNYPQKMSNQNQQNNPQQTDGLPDVRKILPKDETFSSKNASYLFSSSDYFCLVDEEQHLLSFLSPTTGTLLLQISTDDLSLPGYKFSEAIATHPNKIYLTLMPRFYGQARLIRMNISLQHIESLSVEDQAEIYMAPGYSLQGPIIANDNSAYLLQMNDQNTELVIIDLNDEVVRSVIPLSADFNYCTSFTIVLNYLCAALSDGRIVTMDVDSRTTKTLYNTKSSAQISPLATDGNCLIFGVYGNRNPSKIYKMNNIIDTIVQELFELPPAPDSGLHRAITGRPLILNDEVYVQGCNHFLHALDIDTGTELWRYEMARRIELSPVYTDKGLVVADRAGNVDILTVYKQIKEKHTQPQRNKTDHYNEMGNEKDRTISIYDFYNTEDLPQMADRFLKAQDRKWLANLISNLPTFRTRLEQEHLLTDSDIPNQWVNEIPFSESRLTTAKTIIRDLEKRGRLLETPSVYALGALLKNILESLGLDDSIKVVSIIFAYQLITDPHQLSKLSAKYKVPLHIFEKSDVISRNKPMVSYPFEIHTSELKRKAQSLFYNGRKNYRDANFLINGAKATQTVCRIEWDGKAEGTGFLIGNNLVLTNYHVIKPFEKNIDRLGIRFGAIETPEGSVSAGTAWKKLDSGKGILEKSSEDELDFVLLKLESPVPLGNGIKVAEISPDGIEEGNYANIIQHPLGGPMKVAFRYNQVVKVSQNRIYYLSDTQNGSSGAPVFNDKWQIVALHRAGGLEDKTGKVILEGNEGIPIIPIYERVKPHL